MSTTPLAQFSDALADAVAEVAPSVVQVQGRRRPGSGLVIDTDVIVTNARALGREDQIKVKAHDGRTVDAELAGWDPSTGLAVLRAAGLGIAPARKSETTPRVGHVVLAIARSWSNAVTASTGTIAVIGGPLRTGRRRSIEQVIRTTAPMHDGFAGGPLVDTSGQVIGVSTAAAIRGFEVAIPAPIVWATASDVLTRGRTSRGFLGIAGQPVQLGGKQRGAGTRERALLIVGVTPDSPAEQAGVLVGDILLQFDGVDTQSTDDLLDLLAGDRVGKTVPLALLRGGAPATIQVTVGARSAS